MNNLSTKTVWGLKLLSYLCMQVWYVRIVHLWWTYDKCYWRFLPCLGTSGVKVKGDSIITCHSFIINEWFVNRNCLRSRAAVLYHIDQPWHLPVCDICQVLDGRCPSGPMLSWFVRKGHTVIKILDGGNEYCAPAMPGVNWDDLSGLKRPDFHIAHAIWLIGTT